MKKAITILLLIMFTSISIHAQDVKAKDINFKAAQGFITLNKENIFKLKYSSSYFYIYNLESGKEVMYIYINDNETLHYLEDDYYKVYFTNSKKSFESKLHHRFIIERLINEGVITSDWLINDEKVDDFIDRYGENITDRTIR